MAGTIAGKAHTQSQRWFSSQNCVSESIRGASCSYAVPGFPAGSGASCSYGVSGFPASGRKLKDFSLHSHGSFTRLPELLSWRQEGRNKTKSWDRMGAFATARVANEEEVSSPTDNLDLKHEPAEDAVKPKEPEKYEADLEVALRAVQLSCNLSQEVQERILTEQEKADKKRDRSLVTVADYGVQAVVSWVLAQTFPGESIQLVAEEDTDALTGRAGIEILQRVVAAVNECLMEANKVNIRPPEEPLTSVDVLKLINRGAYEGGAKGRFWVLDPVDGTLGFTRGDQYAVALALVEEGKVVVGVLGCPNYPLRKEWLRHPHRYFRVARTLFPPQPGMWDKGVIMFARQGGGAWMEPLIWSPAGPFREELLQRVTVSSVVDPADAIFCEPVEKGNSSQEYTAQLARDLGIGKKPLRVYSMAKYAAIARGDAEIFMKFARAGYQEKIWDHAAGIIVVEEADGSVTDAGGEPLDFSKGRLLTTLDRGIVASCGKMVHSALMESIDASWESAKL